MQSPVLFTPRECFFGFVEAFARIAPFRKAIRVPYILTQKRMKP